MKKIYSFSLLLITTIVFSQDIDSTTTKKNEFKINAAYTIGGIPEFTYERIINEESSFGTSILFSADKSSEITFALTPYYRFYFGKKIASGFFVEGFSMFNTIKPNDIYYEYYDFNNSIYVEKIIKKDSFSSLAFGFSVGGKWYTKRGIIFEINGGLGRNFLNRDKTEKYGYELVPRAGLVIGYRF